MRSGAGQRRAMLTVRGRGQNKVKPDRARVMLLVVREAESANEVNKMVTLVVNELLSLLEAGTGGRATAIQTENLRIETVYEQRPVVENVRYDEEKERRIVGYKAALPVSFECIVGDISELIELVLSQQDSPVVVRGLEYLVSEALVAPAYMRALQLAITDAETQAAVVLEALKLERRGLLSVEIHDSGYQHGEAMAVGQEESYASFSQKKALYAGATGFRAPEGEISAAVTLVIAY